MATTYGSFAIEVRTDPDGVTRRIGWVLTVYRRDGHTWTIRAQMFLEDAGGRGTGPWR